MVVCDKANKQISCLLRKQPDVQIFQRHQELQKYYEKKLIGLPNVEVVKKAKLFVKANNSKLTYNTRGTSRLEALWPGVNALIGSSRKIIGLDHCQDLLYVHFVNVNLMKTVEFNKKMKYNFLNAAMFDMYVNTYGKFYQ